MNKILIAEDDASIANLYADRPHRGGLRLYLRAGRQGGRRPAGAGALDGVLMQKCGNFDGTER